MSIGIQIDPVDAWGLVCTAYARNSLVAHAWSQLPRPYRIAWVMFIEQLLAEINSRLPPALQAGIREVEASRQHYEPALQTLRTKLTEAIGKYQKVERAACEERSRMDRMAGKVRLLESQLAQARYQLEQYVGGGVPFVTIPKKYRYSQVRKEDVYRRPSAEEPFALAFPTREQQERFEAILSHLDEQQTIVGFETPRRNR